MAKTIEQARANYDASLSTVPTRYKAGIEQGEWASSAASDQSEQNWAMETAQAGIEKRRQRGIRKVGDEGWKMGALSKGVTTIATQMRAAEDKYVTNFAPILSAVTAKVRTLPAKTSDAMANIDARLKPVVETMIAAKKR